MQLDKWGGDRGDAGNSEWSGTEWTGTGSNNFSMWSMIHDLDFKQ